MTKPIRGTFSVTITAFDETGALDLDAQARFTEWQISEGIHGLIPLGSTGEFLSMTDEERHQVAECVIRTVRGRVPVLIGTGSERTEDAIRYSRDAEALGADGVMVISPYYSTPTPDELFEYYRRIAEAISIPIMLYNNPATTNVDLTPPIVARLSEIDGVRYIKESTMEVTRIRDILELCGDKISVFGGILGYESFACGAEGWVAVGSNIMPKAFSRVFSMAVDEKDYEGARRLNNELLPIIRMVGGHRYVSGTKTALTMMGHKVGGPRAPRLPTPRQETPAIEATLASLGLVPGKVA